MSMIMTVIAFLIFIPMMAILLAMIMLVGAYFIMGFIDMLENLFEVWRR